MRSGVRSRVITSIALTLVMGITLIGATDTPSEADSDCTRRYVAGGDSVVVGKDLDGATPDQNKLQHDGESDRYSDQLLKDKLKKVPGPWCLINTSKDPTTTKQYMSDGQQSEAWNKRPHLITLTVGRQNDGIVDHVTKCFQNIKDHDFIEANACAIAVLANQPAWDQLTKDLSEILGNYRTQMSGNPHMVVAVTGYYNPYNKATTVATKIPGFCADLQDTIPTCLVRWVMLPPALVTLDLVVQKLNTTIDEVVQYFTAGTQGRIVFVNPYEKFKDHCMTMKVKIETKVYHPKATVHDHNTKETNFGCDTTWIASDKKDGNKTPFLYLTPAVTGVLLVATQTTKEMGIHPNKDGHKCIAELIWEATKHKLDVPEAPKEPCS